MKRRGFLGAATGVVAFRALRGAPAKRSKLGVAATSYLSYWRPKDTLEFLEHCNELGAAGIQAPLASLEPEYLSKVEKRAKDLGMYVEVAAPFPRTDFEKFTATLEAAKKIGALCVRTACLSGRRYETFQSMDDWKKFVETSLATIERVVPAADKAKIPICLENHKDWTVDEFLFILKRYSSEYLGVCLDTGNNIALLDDTYELVEKLAPWAISTHIKDMAVQPYPEGLLLSEMVFGTGMLDLKRIVSTIEKARPNTRLTCEMITRDPLKVPCMTNEYWVTFPDRRAQNMGTAMRLVRDHSRQLPSFSQMTREQQLAAENENVKKCLAVMA